MESAEPAGWIQCWKVQDEEHQLMPSRHPGSGPGPNRHLRMGILPPVSMNAKNGSIFACIKLSCY